MGEEAHRRGDTLMHIDRLGVAELRSKWEQGPAQEHHDPTNEKIEKEDQARLHEEESRLRHEEDMLALKEAEEALRLQEIESEARRETMMQMNEQRLLFEELEDGAVLY